ncbi:regulatory protein [Pseudozyma hubeiensis SY62]|uniref:Regulatory protein n=1 Tax=Pseudozyma hubeiensis (strain SY62) TaxID=1305764 RepID=R9P5P4_PSEHS|nr:regulatory protein [Pseudozyma hubeiensis SY62]GAC96562.1 regulatory protein [Pseudozyma hubeiensis SY62]
MKSKPDTVLSGYKSTSIPVLDSTTANTDILARIALTFPASLSLSQLEDSWYALVRAWPVLAARVRPTPSTPSGLSFFIPTPAKLDELEKRSRTTSNPLEKHIVVLDDSTHSVSAYHPIVGQAVQSQLDDTQISIGSSPEKKRLNESTCTNACTSWKQLLATDQAYVTAQATKWSDATSLCIAFSHTLGDAFAVKDIFAAWAKALRGEVVAGLDGVGVDPFGRFLPHDGEKVEKLPLGWKKFGLANKIKLISHLLWDIQVKRPEKTIKQYYVYIPKSKVDALVAEAKADVKRIRSASTEEESAREYTVSTFNVLFAWLLQNLHAANRHPSRHSSVLCVVNAKTRPPTGHIPSDYPQHQLWGGAFGVPLRRLLVRDYATLPLGQLALHIRVSLNEQIAPDNIRSNVRMLLRETLWKKPSGEMVWFSPEPRDEWCGCTEWRSVKFGDVEIDKCRPVAISTHMEIPMTQRNRWALLGDAGGGVWFSGGMTETEARWKDGFGRYKWVG